MQCTCGISRCINGKHMKDDQSKQCSSKAVGKTPPCPGQLQPKQRNSLEPAEQNQSYQAIKGPGAHIFSPVTQSGCTDKVLKIGLITVVRQHQSQRCDTQPLVYLVHPIQPAKQRLQQF